MPGIKRESEEQSSFHSKVARSEGTGRLQELSEREEVEQGSSIDRTRHVALSAVFGQEGVRGSGGARESLDLEKSKEINKQIVDVSKRQDSAKLWAILRREERSFDAVNISTWIYQCAKQSNASELFQDLRFETAKTILLEKLSQFGSWELSNTAWAFATAGMFDEEVFGKIAGEIRARRDLRKFNPQDFSNMLWAFATARIFDRDVFEKIALEIREKSDLRGFNPQNLSNTAWAYAKTRVVDREVFGKIAEEMRARRNLRDFNPQNLSNTAWAYAKTGVVDRDVFEKIAEEMRARRDLRDFNPQELSNMAWAYATVGVIDRDVFGKIAEEMRARRNLRDFNPQNLSNTVWAFAIYCVYLADKSTEACLKEIVKNLLPRASHISLTLEDRSQVGLAAAFFKIETDCLDVQASSSSRVSNLEREVQRYLPQEFIPQKDLGRECAHHIADFYREIDRMVIEVDGPSHFYPKSDSRYGDPLPQTVLRNAILERNGYKVKSICYREWGRLHSEEDKRTYIEALLKD